ncbi:uncharacterized protein [Aegilops tauschii subsp. strangulata]
MRVEANVGSYHNGGSEVVGDSNDMAAQNTSTASMGDEGDAEGVVVNKSKASCWTRRVRIGNAPEERDANPSRVPALEASMRAYADNKGKPLQSNSRSTRCGFPALMQVLRWDDKGWYICEHKAEDNHAVSVNCMEKLHWKSHRHIDRYTRDLVKQLRENNISLSKVYSVVGSFFGYVKEVPFTKRSLKTLCGKLNREQSKNDATKTIEVFNAMRAEDPEFKYSLQVDSDG